MVKENIVRKLVNICKAIQIMCVKLPIRVTRSHGNYSQLKLSLWEVEDDD